MSFFQSPPELGNQYTTDRVLRRYLERRVPPDALGEMERQLEPFGALVAGELYEGALRDRRDEPELTYYDAWGNRIDEIRITPFWQRCAEVAATEGLVATAYEQRHGPLSRIHQFALVYLFDPSSHVYTCPLAMTDGCAKTLSLLAEPHDRDRIVPRLIDRNPETAWTSGQWMTERTGGSDVGRSETVAREASDGWRISGDKWFTSATTSQVALTLARPEGAPAGGKGLAMFLVDVRLPDGSWNGISVRRLKDKLGTRMVPTAELTLDDTLATPIGGLTGGVRNIATMLNITRTWNAVCSTAKMRRGIALARDYAPKRVAFGAPLSEKPLHLHTLAGMQAEMEAAFMLTFRCAELLGLDETGEATEDDLRLLRILTPLMKLTAGKQSNAVCSETLECFGGAGYVEDTGLPMLLRDTQVGSIWEGTTNVLSLDTLRAMAREQALGPFLTELRTRAGKGTDPSLKHPVDVVNTAAQRIEWWLAEAQAIGMDVVEAGARRLAMTMGRAMELALLIDEAQWNLDTHRDGRTAAAARRFAHHEIDSLLHPGQEMEDTRALALDVE